MDASVGLVKAYLELHGYCVIAIASREVHRP